MNYMKVIDFWFSELKPSQWFAKDLELDAEIKRRFGDLHRQAAACELASWRDHDLGVLAEILLLDQFSRNLFRDSATAFAYDAQALILAQEAVRRRLHLSLDNRYAHFVLMPYMHSESALVHQMGLPLFEALGNDNVLKFELEHKGIIDRFGRYPHRNALLGRESSEEEKAFLLTHKGF